MKHIYFIRSGSYSYIQDKYDLYTSFDVVARGRADPPLSQEGKFEVMRVRKKMKKATVAISSRSLRCHQTAQILCKKVIIHPLVSEINYSMRQIVSKQKFYDKLGKPRIDNARQLFVSSFTKDRLGESFLECIQRIESLFDYLQGLPDTTIIVVSHGFYLKVVECYIRHPEIVSKRQKLQRYFTGKEQTFSFCSGYVVNMFDRNKLLIKTLIR